VELPGAGDVLGVLDMIVVTAGTREYRLIAAAQRRKCRQFGYTHVVFDLGGLGIGAEHEVPASDFIPTVNGDSLPPATFKASLVAEQLQLAAQNELVCWLDADCLPVKPFSPDELQTGGFDAAVTLRPANEIGLSNNPALDYLNSGVVWIRNTPAGRRFCADWSARSIALKTDQGALNDAVCPIWNGADWKAAVGAVHQATCGARTLVLDATEWNSWHFPPPASARILHFKGGIRYLAKDYINR
jgi:hypothetical protein